MGMIKKSEFYWLADKAHFFGALAAISSCGLFHVERIACAVVVAFAACKEGYWDPRHESKVVCGSGLRDFLGYLAGAALGLLLCWLARHSGIHPAG